MFHGTDAGAVEGIVKDGFKIGGSGGVAVAHGAAHGKGVYVSEDPKFAMRYIRDGRKRLLFALVCESTDAKVVKDAAGVIQQMILKHPQQLLPCYVVEYQ